jgi:hypothetical protein
MLPDSTDIKRITKVFQVLLDFIEECGECNDQSPEGSGGSDVSDSTIQSLVLKLQVAHKSFETGITKYIHKNKRKDLQVKIVEKIVKASPEYLSMRNKKGNLPIHSAAIDGSSFSSTCVQFFAKAGMQHRVGGTSGRGGLTIKDSDGQRPLTTITFRGDVNSMKALQSFQPPLLKKKDVCRYQLLHFATTGNNLDMMKMMIVIDPAALYITSPSGKLPIHLTKTLKAANLLLKGATKYDRKHDSIGGLFAKTSEGMMAITHMINTFGKEDTWRCIENALSLNYDTPILHKAIIYAPEYINDIITRFPDTCFVHDKNGRLPIHVALETGMKWSLTLSSMMNASMEHLRDVDPLTKLRPSALAALEPACDSRTINYLDSKYLKNVT